MRALAVLLAFITGVIVGVITFASYIGDRYRGNEYAANRLTTDRHPYNDVGTDIDVGGYDDG